MGHALSSWSPGEQARLPSTFTEKVMLAPSLTVLLVNLSRNLGGASCSSTSGETCGSGEGYLWGRPLDPTAPRHPHVAAAPLSSAQLAHPSFPRPCPPCPGRSSSPPLFLGFPPLPGFYLFCPLPAPLPLCRGDVSLRAPPRPPPAPPQHVSGHSPDAGFSSVSLRPERGTEVRPAAAGAPSPGQWACSVGRGSYTQCPS